MAGPSRASAFDNNYDNPYPTPESSRSSRYSPYKSVVSHVSSETAAFVVPTPEPAPSKPPWRRQLGQVWFGLSSQYGALLGEAVAPEEEATFSVIVERMFAGFSEKEDWVVRIDDGQEDIFSMTVDVDRDIGGSDGKSHVLYNRTEELDSTPSKPIRQKQVCWNCRESGHILGDCPYPRDQLQIRASRDAFNAQRDAMPDFAQPYLASYTYTAEERDRRIALASRFTPGIVSEELQDALFWAEDEDGEIEDGIIVNPRRGDGRDKMEESAGQRRVRTAMMAVRKKRGDWPWFEWMLKWGYPPGWVSGKDPMGEVVRRLESKEIETDIPDSDSEDDLQVFGEQEEIAPLPASRSIRRLLRDGSADMVLLTPTPSPPPLPSPDEPNPPSPPAAPPPSLAGDFPPPPASPPPPPPPPPPCTGHPTLPHPPISSYRHQDSSRPSVQSHTISHDIYPPLRRWADYKTRQFDSERLMMYSEARPLPLGH